MTFAALSDLTVLEFDAIGPVPFCAMMLADHGAQVTRITRPGGQPNGVDAGDADLLLRGRATQVPLDLKSDTGRAQALDLIARTEVLVEGHRPGVMERLGLGPEACHAVNPALVYCRITGYGQSGPLANHPGHDINYVAQTGALHGIGPADLPPPPPLSLIGDFGGGGMLGAFGILAAVIKARATGQGAVIDAAMVDGAALQMAMTYGWANAGFWQSARAANLLDGAAPFYRCYETADGRYLAAGAIEPKFYAVMRQVLGLDDPVFDDQMNRSLWLQMSDLVAQQIARMTPADLDAAVATPDACLSWVVPMAELGRDDHMAARQMVTRDGTTIRLGTAPRMSPAG